MRRGAMGTGRVVLAVIAAAVMVFSGVMAVVGTSPGVVSAASLNSAAVLPASSDALAAPAVPASNSPHPGTIVDYGSGLGGGGLSQSLDPAVQYDTVDGQVDLNVYQDLIAYNGSSTANLLPQVSTCVPGNTTATNPDSCAKMYGSPLITYNSTTGYPATYTFPIDSAAHFYNPATHASWGVYPSDVFYSIARAMVYQFWFEAYPGWIVAQSLLPPTGNVSWEVSPEASTGVYTFSGTLTNSSPLWIMTSMLVNDSTYCPGAAMTSAHGCITFVVGRNGLDGYGPSAGGARQFPFFLTTLIADGSWIAPAGWFQYQGSISSNANATLPGWPQTTAPDGDGPTLLPGDATTTSSSAFQTALSGFTPAFWFAFANNANNWPGLLTNPGPNPGAQFDAVGSGPYYLVSFSDSTGYILQANPAYRQPTGCAGQPACQPRAGSYVPTIDEYYSTTDTAAIAALAAGQADFGGIFLPADLATFDSLVASNKINYVSAPSLSVFYQAPNMIFNVSAANALTAGVGTTNVPGTFFSNIAIRQLLITSVPYATLNSSLYQLAGPTENTTIDTAWLAGGAIPQGMRDLATGQQYYNFSIPWGSQNPNTNPSVVGSAAWWWKQAITPGSGYYVPSAAACTSSSPCTFPFIGEVGDTALDDTMHFEIAELEAITGGAIKPFSMDLEFAQLGECSVPVNQPGTPGGGGSNNPCPTQNLGWAPDYPDPTDYVPTFYYPDSIFTADTGLGEVMLEPQNNNASCMGYSPLGIHGIYTVADLNYYAGLSVMPSDCQGVAYDVAHYFFAEAGSSAPGATRVNYYRTANAIMYLLGIYIWNEQENTVVAAAPWISQAGINLNVMIGGGGMQPWWEFPNNGTGTYAVTFSSSGLPKGTTWSFDLNGMTGASLGTSGYATEPNGTYAYQITPIPGYTMTNSSGTVTVRGAAVTAPTVVFTPSVPPTPTTPVSSTYLSPLAWALFGTFLALTIIFIATTVVYARRGNNRPKSPPPEAWKQESPPPPKQQPPT